MFELLSDEVTDMEKYMYLYDLSVSEGDHKMAKFFHGLAERENEDALELNAQYQAHGYTNGTESERMMWDHEYEELMKRHKDALARITHAAAQTASVKA